MANSVTTIQVHSGIKTQLDALKEKGNDESYEEVIVKLMESAEKQKRADTKLMIEGYTEMAKESLKVTKEWAVADLDW